MLIELERTRDAKTFQLPDGRRRTTFGHSVHYLSGGEWRDTDLRLRPMSDRLLMDGFDYHAQVGDRGVAIYDPVAHTGVRWLTPNRPRAHGGGRTVGFRQDGLVWRWEILKAGLKLAARVHRRRGPRVYTFRYEPVGDGGHFEQDINGHLWAGNLMVKRPIVVGADGMVWQTSPWISSPGKASFVFDDSLLPDSAFPYVIDPTTNYSLAAQANDGYTSGSNASYPPGSASVADTTGTVLYVTRSYVAVTGMYPGTGTNADTGEFDDQPWSNASRVVAQDGSYASVTIYDFDETFRDNSELLRATNYGFAVSGTVTGITVRVRCYATVSPSDVRMFVKMLKAGSPVGTQKTEDSDIPGSMGDLTFGSSSDLWGTTWTSGEVNASNFGVQISADNSLSSGSSSLRVDTVQVTIHTSTGGAYTVDVGHLRWDTSALDDTVTVDSAALKLYVVSKADGDARNLSAEWNEPGTITVADWTSTPASGAGAWDITTLTAGAQNTLALATVSNVSKTAHTGLRLHIDGGSPAGSNQVAIASYDHASYAEPILAVTYSVSPPPAPVEIPRVLVGSAL